MEHHARRDKPNTVRDFSRLVARLAIAALWSAGAVLSLSTGEAMLAHSKRGLPKLRLGQEFDKITPDSIGTSEPWRTLVVFVIKGVSQMQAESASLCYAETTCSFSNLLVWQPVIPGEQSATRNPGKKSTSERPGPPSTMLRTGSLTKGEKIPVERATHVQDLCSDHVECGSHAPALIG